MTRRRVADEGDELRIRVRDCCEESRRRVEMRPASCEASYGVRKVGSKIYHGGAEGTGGSVVVYMSKGEFARGSYRACTRPRSKTAIGNSF